MHLIALSHKHNYPGLSIIWSQSQWYVNGHTHDYLQCLLHTIVHSTFILGCSDAFSCVLCSELLLTCAFQLSLLCCFCVQVTLQSVSLLYIALSTMLVLFVPKLYELFSDPKNYISRRTTKDTR